MKSPINSIIKKLTRTLILSVVYTALIPAQDQKIASIPQWIPVEMNKKIVSYFNKNAVNPLTIGKLEDLITQAINQHQAYFITLVASGDENSKIERNWYDAHALNQWLWGEYLWDNKNKMVSFVKKKGSPRSKKIRSPRTIDLITRQPIIGIGYFKYHPFSKKFIYEFGFLRKENQTVQPDTIQNHLWYLYANTLSLYEKQINDWITEKYHEELMQAAYQGNIDTALELVYEGADVNKPGSKGTTPLMALLNRVRQECPEQKFTYLIDLAMAQNGNINAQNSEGITALMYAVDNPFICLAVIQQLLLTGADINLRDKNGRTALMYAARQGNNDIVDMLVRSGAKIKLKDNDGYDAYAYTESNEIKELLTQYTGV